jgi:hypothetical protein
MKTALLCFVLALFYLPLVAAEQSAPTQIAFLPDIHFHDVYAEFNDGSFKGIAGKHKAATIRTLSCNPPGFLMKTTLPLRPLWMT